MPLPSFYIFLKKWSRRLPFHASPCRHTNGLIYRVLNPLTHLVLLPTPYTGKIVALLNKAGIEWSRCNSCSSHHFGIVIPSLLLGLRVRGTCLLGPLTNPFSIGPTLWVLLPWPGHDLFKILVPLNSKAKWAL